MNLAVSKCNSSKWSKKLTEFNSTEAQMQSNTPSTTHFVLNRLLGFPQFMDVPQNNILPRALTCVHAIKALHYLTLPYLTLVTLTLLDANTVVPSKTFYKRAASVHSQRADRQQLKALTCFLLARICFAFDLHSSTFSICVAMMLSSAHSANMPICTHNG